MQLEELIPNLNLEDYTNEFKGIIKEGSKPDSDERLEYSWLRTLAAFSNSNGGNLYIGVENKTHKILSLTHVEVDKISLMIQRQIKEKISPELDYKIVPIALPDTSPTRYLLKVQVKKSQFPLTALKEKGINAIYVRKFGENSIATPNELIELVSNSNYVSYDSRFTNFQFDKKDFTKLFNYYKKVNNKELTIKELISIGFINQSNQLSEGALMFKDDYKDTRTLVECTWFNGYSKGDDIFLASSSFNCNLLDEFLNIVDFVKSHSADGYEKKGMSRIDYISYPLEALKEAAANCLGHRNYYLNGSQIEINIFKDRVEFISPGSLINSTENLKRYTSLSSIPPLRRNEVICATFTILKIMEKKGSGFDKITELYKPYGDKYAPFIDTSNQYFSLTLPDLTHKEGLVIDNEAPKIKTIMELTGKHDMNILSYCYKESKTASEIAKYLHIKSTTYFRDEVLQKLVDKDYLLKITNSFPAKYYSNHNKVFLD